MEEAYGKVSLKEEKAVNPIFSFNLLFNSYEFIANGTRHSFSSELALIKLEHESVECGDGYRQQKQSESGETTEFLALCRMH